MKYLAESVSDLVLPDPNKIRLSLFDINYFNLLRVDLLTIPDMLYANDYVVVKSLSRKYKVLEQISVSIGIAIRCTVEIVPY